jgi:hypothetical protein
MNRCEKSVRNGSGARFTGDHALASGSVKWANAAEDKKDWLVSKPASGQDVLGFYGEVT